MPQKVDELFFELGANTAPLIAGVGRAQGTLQKFSAFLKTPQGALAALGVTAALVGAQAAKMAAELDKALREVSTLLPVTVEQMGELRQEIIDLSTRVPEPPPQLTKGLYQVISAGITDTAEAMQVLEVASKAAVAGLSDSFTAVDALTTVINAYALSAGEAEAVSDVFFATIAEGKLTFTDLASNIGGVATTAALAGVSIEELGALLATATKSGLGMEEAVTGLNRWFLTLIDTDEKALALMEELGIEWNTSAVAARGFTAVMNDMAEAAGGDVDILGKLNPEIRAFRVAAILAGTSTDEYNRILESTTESTGDAQTAFDKMAGSADVLWDTLKNKLGAGFLTLGKITLPPVIALLKTMNFLLAGPTGKIGLLDIVDELNSVEVSAGINANLRETRELLDRQRELRAIRAQGKDVVGQHEFEAASVELWHIEDEINRLFDERTALRERENALAETAEELAKRRGELEEKLRAEREAARKEHEEELSEKQVQARRQLIDQLTALTLTKVDDMERAFVGMIAGIGEAFEIELPEAIKDGLARAVDPAVFAQVLERLPEEIAGQLTQVRDQIAAVRVAEPLIDDIKELEERLGDLERTGTDTGTAVVSLALDFMAVRDRTIELMQGTDRVTSTYRELEKQLRRVEAALEDLTTAGPPGVTTGPTTEGIQEVEGELNRLLDSGEDAATVLLKLQSVMQRTGVQTSDLSETAQRYIAALEESLDATDRVLVGWDKMGSEAARLARSVIDLGRAFGVFGDSVAAQANSIINLIDNITALKAATTEMAQMTAGVGIVTAGLSIFTGFLGMLGRDKGPSPEEIARQQAQKRFQEAMERNTQAIERLTQVWTEQQARVIRQRGEQFAQIGQAIVDAWATVIADPLGEGGFEARLEQFLSPLGISIEDARLAAASLGITLDENAWSWIQLAEAIEAADIQRLANDLAMLNREFELFDIDDVTEQVKRLGELLAASFTDAEMAALDALGVGEQVRKLAAGELSAEETDALMRELFGLFSQGVVGGGQLGGERFLDLLGQIERLLDQEADAVEDGVTRGFQVTRGITEVTGNRLAGLLATDVFWNKMTADNTFAMAQALDALRFLNGGTLGLVPPGTGGRGGIERPVLPPLAQTIQITAPIEVTGATDPEATGLAVAKALTEEVNVKLGVELIETRRASGLKPSEGLR